VEVRALAFKLHSATLLFFRFANRLTQKIVLAAAITGKIIGSLIVNS
jgi:hypothetical protein